MKAEWKAELLDAIEHLKAKEIYERRQAKRDRRRLAKRRRRAQARRC